MTKKATILLLTLTILTTFSLATYATSINAYETNNDDQVYLSEWTTFYANFTSDDGFNLGQVEYRNPSTFGTSYAIGGFDPDGTGNKTAIAFSETDDIYAYYSNGTQIWQTTDATFDNAYKIMGGDFNNDGQDEVAFISSHGELFILNGTNGSILYQSTDYYTGYSMANGDLDDDGYSDDFILGVRDRLGGTANNWGIVAIIYNDASGNFEENWTAGGFSNYPTEVDISEVTGINLVGAADYNGFARIFYADDGASNLPGCFC